MFRSAAFITVAAVASFASAAGFSLNPIVRDFHVTQTDFEILDWNNHTPLAYFNNDQSNKIEKGIAGPLGSPLDANGLPVYSSGREPGFYNTVSSAASFAAWYTDSSANTRVAGVVLPFAANGDGTFTFSSAAFFPIDTAGFGTEGFDHNYHFTLQQHATFTYVPGQVFSTISDDDNFVYINRKLVIDGGGVHGTLGGSVNLDDLGLTAGNVYDLDLFYAERNRYGAGLTVTTNIPLPEPSSLLPILVTLPLLRRRGSRSTRIG